LAVAVASARFRQALAVIARVGLANYRGLRVRAGSVAFRGAPVGTRAGIAVCGRRRLLASWSDQHRQGYQGNEQGWIATIKRRDMRIGFTHEITSQEPSVKQWNLEPWTCPSTKG
jgi:hypothetical protein